jgi:hypothetical protein
MKARVGEVKLVENKDKRSGANESYYGVVLKNGDQYNSLLFTEHELQMAFQRAVSNQEDVVDRSFLSLLID